MMPSKLSTKILLCVAYALIACQLGAAAEGPIAARNMSVDVRLGEGGLLRGYVVDRQGAPQDQAVVTLQTSQATSVQATSVQAVAVQAVADVRGRFSVSGLRGGQYRIAVGEHNFVCRLWTDSTAPPHAKSELLLVVGQAVRGQAFAESDTGVAMPGHFDGIFWRALRNPWIVGGLTAAAIAVPIALDDKDAS